LTKIINYMLDKKIPAAQTLRARLSTVEIRTGKTVRSHLGFGESNNPIKELSWDDGNIYFGETNSENNNREGRGIYIHSSG
jgi:hypothetical protein